MLDAPTPKTKRCKKCGVVKSFDDFYNATAARDGKRGECIACAKIIRREWYLNNRESSIERTKRWQRENPEKYKAWRERNLAANSERRRKWHRRYHLRSKYGLSVEDYEFLMVVYDSKCGICGREQPDGLHIDHEHESGRIRGLLCGSCNRAIGLMQDSPKVLRAAAKYLENPQYPLAAGDRGD